MVLPSHDPFQRVESLLRSGDHDSARRELIKLLETDPDSAKGWWLMSYAVRDPGKQVECLERVLELHPDHRKAQARISALTGESQPIGMALKEKLSGSKFKVALILVLGCVVVLAAGYLGYKLFFPAQTALPTRVEIVQEPVFSITPAAEAALSTNTPTPLSLVTETSQPAVTHTPTLDPEILSTPIPENLIGKDIGQYPPDFNLKNAITNQEVSLRELTGRPVLLVFFNTLTSEADPGMPGLQAVYEKYQDQGLVILGIGVGSSQSALRNYTGRFGGLTFPLLSDWEHTIAKAYEVDILPTTIFIRKNGKIWQVNTVNLSEAELDLVIASLFKMP